MKLIITEKPSVARDIARVLKITNKKDGYFESKDTQITWAFGHLIQLLQPDEYDEKYKRWNLTDLPIIPDEFKKAVVKDQGAKHQLNSIITLLKNESLKEVICATDAGREGELIFRYIYQEAKATAPIKRLWISSQTDKAIKDGFENLLDGDDLIPLFHSAISRAEADWIIGINATRAYSVKFSRGTGVLSVGRVQTPVLNMIVERTIENRDFKPETFYEIYANVEHKNGKFTAKLFDGKESRIEKQEQAEETLQAFKQEKQGKIVAYQPKEKRETPPLLYDLTELQKDANRRFKFSADQTLKTAQALYETHKLITYPRTSSRYLSKDLEPTLPNLINKVGTCEEFKSFCSEIKEKNYSLNKRMINDTKVTDHHAMIPTDNTPNLARLNHDESRLYTLIIQRFISAFYPDCIKHTTEIVAQFGKFSLKANGTVIAEPGWRLVSGSDDADSKQAQLPKCAVDDTVTKSKDKLNKSQTKAPPLYTEASILAAMETAGKNIDDEDLRQAMKSCGLGTPATRAQIIERLIAVKYIERDKQKLVATEKGLYLINVIQHQALLSPELTGEWEKHLNDIADNKYSRETYMTKIKTFADDIVEKVEESEGPSLVPNGKSIGECPLCSGAVLENKAAFGCSNWKERQCGFKIWKSIAGKVINEKMAKALLSKNETAVIKGFKSKKGTSFDAKLTLVKGDVTFQFEDGKPSLGPCPVCGGTIKETLKGYGCSNWKSQGCNFVVWKEMAQKKISVSDVKILLKNGVTDELKGFKSRAGKLFNAQLELVEGKVNFKFS